MTTVNRIIEVLKEAAHPMTSAELAKACKVSGGAASGALWRLEQAGSVARNEQEGQRRYSYKSDAKLPRTRSSPQRKRSIAATLTITLRVNGTAHNISLAEAQALYDQLSQLFPK